MSKRSITRCGGLNAHRLIAETAMGLANEWFEVYASKNDYYRKMTAEGRVTEKNAREFFVMRMAPKLYEDARAALADCLTKPDISDYMKDEILEALVLDNDLRANRLVSTQAATIPNHLH